MELSSKFKIKSGHLVNLKVHTEGQLWKGRCQFHHKFWSSVGVGNYSSHSYQYYGPTDDHILKFNHESELNEEIKSEVLRLESELWDLLQDQ